MRLKVKARTSFPRFKYLEQGAAALSREAQRRPAWFDCQAARSRNAALTGRYFDVSRQTFYGSKGRYKVNGQWERADGTRTEKF